MNVNYTVLSYNFCVKYHVFASVLLKKTAKRANVVYKMSNFGKFAQFVSQFLKKFVHSTILAPNLF